MPKVGRVRLDALCVGGSYKTLAMTGRLGWEPYEGSLERRNLRLEILGPLGGVNRVGYSRPLVGPSHPRRWRDFLYPGEEFDPECPYRLVCNWSIWCHHCGSRLQVVDRRRWQAPEGLNPFTGEVRTRKWRLCGLCVSSCPNGCDDDVLLQFWRDHPGCSLDLINQYIHLVRKLCEQDRLTDPVYLQRQLELQAQREAERRQREAELAEVAREEAAEKRRRRRLTPEERQAEDAHLKRVWADALVLYERKHAKVRASARGSGGGSSDP
jgi:ferredoxin